MSNTESPYATERLTPIGRLTDSIIERRMGRFVAELVLIVAGILIALAIDGWVSAAQDRKTEQAYLEFLIRDVGMIRDRARAQIEFEINQVATAAQAFEVLSLPEPASKKTVLEQTLGRLSTRQTLILNSATYDQIVNSGDLQLIRNPLLRDELVRYFDRMERYERITEKNNRDLIDYVYIPFIMRAGISVRSETSSLIATVNRANEVLAEQLGADLAYAEDRVLSAPPDADSWNDIRRNVFLRARISAVGLAIAEAILAESDKVAAALAEELENGRD
jgi:hypothetical protein